MIIISIKPEFEPYYDDIYNSLQNDFNYKELIKTNPIQVKIKDGTIKNNGVTVHKKYSINVRNDEIIKLCEFICTIPQYYERYCKTINNEEIEYVFIDDIIE